jgi:hypothetical protein
LSIRLQADNDLKRIVVDATLSREPRIDFQTAQAALLDDLVLRLVSSRSRMAESGRKNPVLNLKRKP